MEAMVARAGLAVATGITDEEGSIFQHGGAVRMNIRSLALGGVAIALLTNTPVQAQKRTIFITVEELSQDCNGEGEICVGFVIGVADALEATAWPAKRSCRGSEVPLQEVLDRAARLLAAPPSNKAHGPAFDFLADAFVDTWPC